MKSTIVPIGNSKGIRIPKVLLHLCHIEKEVDMEIKGEKIIIKPINTAPRSGWKNAFVKMHENKDDLLLIDDNTDLEMENWQW